MEYKIGLVADRDETSRQGGWCVCVCVLCLATETTTKCVVCVTLTHTESFTWSSYLKTGTLLVHRDGTVSFKMEDTLELTSHLSEKGRGAELSELIVFNGRLYTVDDRSGICELER